MTVPAKAIYIRLAYKRKRDVPVSVFLSQALHLLGRLAVREGYNPLL